MIFQRNESFRNYVRLYPITAFILAANILVFILDTFLLNNKLSLWGMYYQEPVENLYGTNEPWRYVSSIVLHVDWEHLLFNCFSTLVFAPPLERILGHTRYLLFYLAAGIGGNILSAIVNAGSVYASVGASGAIYGIFGGFLYLAIYPKHVLGDAERKTIFFILIFGLIYSVLMPNINIWAHIGGAVTGFALMSMYIGSRKKR